MLLKRETFLPKLFPVHGQTEANGRSQTCVPYCSQEKKEIWGEHFCEYQRQNHKNPQLKFIFFAPYIPKKRLQTTGKAVIHPINLARRPLNDLEDPKRERSRRSSNHQSGKRRRHSSSYAARGGGGGRRGTIIIATPTAF